MADSIDALSRALSDVAGQHGPLLRRALLATFIAVATEAAQNERFASSLTTAWQLGGPGAVPARAPRAAPAQSRRSAPLMDPFQSYSEGGAGGLRKVLSSLDAEQLKDIIAHYDMNHDNAAMRWKKLDRLTDRIVEHVVTRSAKGSSLR